MYNNYLPRTVHLRNKWIQNIPLAAKLELAYGLVQFGSPWNFYHPITLTILALDYERI